MQATFLHIQYILLQWTVSQVRLLLCAVGEEAAIFVKTHILPPDLKPVSHMTCNQSDVTLEKASGPHNCNISELYTLKDVGVCLHAKSLKQQYVTAWSQKVSNPCDLQLEPVEIMLIAMA